MRRNRFLIALVGAVAALAVSAAPARARVDVVTSTQDLAWVASAVGGGNVSVDYLVGSNQDPHRVDPRPSQVVRLTRADLVVRVGMDLDLWFDSLLRAAGNSRILPNGPAYVDASRNIRRLQVPVGKLDPSRGDIHVFGNPHYIFGPSNLRIVADNIADGLKRVDPRNAAEYQSNYERLVSRLESALAGWRAKLAPHRGKAVVTYHPTFIYFLTEFGLREFGTVEPRPGYEPTPGHIATLAQRMKQEGVRVIMAEHYRPRRYSELLARQSGAQIVVVPAGIGALGTKDYFDFMGMIVDRVAAAL